MGKYLDIQDLDLGVTHAMSDDQVENWIKKAESLLALKLQRRGCDLATLMADPVLSDAVIGILQNAVVRVLRNPEGFQTESEDGYSYGRSPVDSAGNVWYPDAELNDLCPGLRKYGTIQLGMPEYRMPTRRR